MSITATLPVKSAGTIIDRFVSRSVVTNIALILGGALLMSLLAQVSIPMFPVPITGQTLGVVLAAAALGSWRGAASMVVYMAAGLAGAPVFANFTGGPLSVLKPSFGFIIGFVFAAFVIGWFAERNWDRNFWKALLGFSIGSLIPFVFGVPYLALIWATNPLNTFTSGPTFAGVMEQGFTLFVIGGVVKAVIAAAVLSISWKAIDTFSMRGKE